MNASDDYLTVVFRCLSPVRRQQITEMREAVRLAWGDQIAERDALAAEAERLREALKAKQGEVTEYYHTLLEKGGRLLKDGEVVQETDYQILGHKKNEAQTPPEKKWLGWKKAQGFPHPTFIRMPGDPAGAGEGERQ